MKLILLSGERATGKTSACERLVALARERGLDCAGILALGALRADGARTEITLLDVATGERRSLTRLSEGEAFLSVGRFHLSATAMDWAVAQVCAALQTDSDLVLVDEIGPLELRQGGGFAPVLPLLPTARARACLLVVRPSLTDELAERLSALRPMVIRLDLANRDGVPGQILALLYRAQPIS